MTEKFTFDDTTNSELEGIADTFAANSDSGKLASDGVGVAVDVAEMAFDPTGLKGAELAADVFVLVLRASKDGVKDPMLADFIEMMAEVGELTAFVAAVANDAVGVGLIAAAVKELGQQALEGVGGETVENAIEDLNSAITELPQEQQDQIASFTPEECDKIVDGVGAAKNAKAISLAQAHNKSEGMSL